MWSSSCCPSSQILDAACSLCILFMHLQLDVFWWKYIEFQPPSLSHDTLEHCGHISSSFSNQSWTSLLAFLWFFFSCICGSYIWSNCNLAHAFLKLVWAIPKVVLFHRLRFSLQAWIDSKTLSVGLLLSHCLQLFVMISWHPSCPINIVANRYNLVPLWLTILSPSVSKVSGIWSN